ncbi:cystatin-B-like isoform X2 [Cuculus canorus]|uniref:cystatin-B-like isoform X2 n=1 Tax=Cuculus canorus TaxID=55661 RepID=UPI0023AA330B|nr:cystatin-B-like isoform X2 [Cuculus canorus]
MPRETPEPEGRPEGEQKKSKSYVHVKSQLEKEVGRAFTIFNAVLYRYQKSVGTSYLIKVEVADGDFNHLLVFQPPLDRKVGPELVRYWTGKTRHDPLEC